MSGLFGMIEVGKRTLFAQQAALGILNHNVANANTPGYSRQRVMLESSPLLGGLYTNMGGGVTVTGVESLQDALLLERMGRVRSSQGEQQALSDGFGLLELVLGEPVDSEFGEVGLGDAIGEFLNSWQPVINPEMEANDADLRGIILESARVLSQRFNSAAQAFQAEAATNERRISATVDEVNGLLDNVAALNGQIASFSLSDSARADLVDVRQQNLDRLTELVGAEWHLDEQNHLRVTVGGRVLVDHNLTHGLSIESGDRGDGRINDVVLHLRGDNFPLDPPGGALKGLLQLQQREIPAMLERLDNLAMKLADSVNAVHQAAEGDGGGGLDIFVGTDASSIALNPVLIDHPEHLSLAGNLPDGRAIAAAIFDLHSEVADGSSGLSLEGLYAEMVGEVGAKSAGAGQLAAATERHLEGLVQERESLSGVNIDEELANMMVIQTTYQAASRVLAVADELLQTLVLGL